MDHRVYDERLGPMEYGPNRRARFHEVANAIIEELIYQRAKWGTIEDNGHDKGTWWILIEAELEEARQALVKGGSGRNSFRSEIIQVAALCFAALEQHGINDDGNGGREIGQ